MYMYKCVYISEVGAWCPTGISFRFVACVRTRRSCVWPRDDIASEGGLWKLQKSSAALGGETVLLIS